ncbi:MAG: phosphoenolpyruvate-dependent sugar phosphotransferase system EIIA 2 [Chloroflexi bacterium HGW-Chloroflexi-3]|nr:MAG: phosphoenolpyruvate-dependent sugar phosphotransferase system EIIA 2 [Chloroflexi bacterium HGW-Chloroflexi-3]
MKVLSVNAIQLNTSAASKEEAIQLAGALLVKTDCVAPKYIQGMLAREKTMSTYLGNGVSIPHGEYENYADIKKTGISIVQLRDGIVWGDDEKVYLVIGIAASSDEHVNVLSRLAEVVDDEDILNILIHTDDPHTIIRYLDGA